MSAIPTENIGSVPRPAELLQAYEQFTKGDLSADALEEIAKKATIETIKRLEETGSPCISDGEQRKFTGFASYCLHGATNLAPDGVEIVFSDGHSRFLPRLLSGPFRYRKTADEFLAFAKQHARVPVKQAVISPSILSLLYPPKGISNYSRAQFIQDVLRQHTGEIRRCLELGAHKVQIDFTEGRLAVKLDPSGELLESMVDLFNQTLDNFSDEERRRIGVHTCPGSDKDATHSADIDYKDLLPTLFKINVGNYYIAMAGEKEPEKALRLIKMLLRPDIRVFIGVIDPIDSRLETSEQVRDRVLAAARFIPVEQLGITDDCGFSPFIDDATTSRELVFAKIKARVEGVKLAEKELLGK
jgi:5-methyltetrahydropteroyltriglutamate--homocysteine methyltransferase